MIQRLTSRKNTVVQRLKRLAVDGAFRRAEREYVCDGRKLLLEALDKGAAVRHVLWRETAEKLPGLAGAEQYTAPGDLFDYVSPMKNSPGPVFTVAMPETITKPVFNQAILLENVQDPGNVGTILRTAAAMGVKTVLLCGSCADVYSPKTVRATMGAVFTETILFSDPMEAREMTRRNGLLFYGAAVSKHASDIRTLDLRHAVVAIGSEGQGLSRELLAVCDGELIIPMVPGSESLNAAMAGTIVLWEMAR